MKKQLQYNKMKGPLKLNLRVSFTLNINPNLLL